VVNPSANQLQRDCKGIVEGITACRKSGGKVILLSLGGAPGAYKLTGAADGTAFADQLWGMFGPRTDDWVRKGLPRPFDPAVGEPNQVDGFDLDIEAAATDNSAGYVALVQRLKANYKSAAKARTYYLTGSPQCVVPDPNMSAMIKATAFDMLFVQYYNTPACSAAKWVKYNSVATYKVGESFYKAGFTLEDW
jgi:chitinase